MHDPGDIFDSAKCYSQGELTREELHDVVRGYPLAVPNRLRRRRRLCHGRGTAAHHGCPRIVEHRPEGRAGCGLSAGMTADQAARPSL